MFQQLHVEGFKCKKKKKEKKIIHKFGNDFIKNYGEDSGKEYILEIDVNILKIVLSFKVIFHF